jgi:hypothetical protein
MDDMERWKLYGKHGSDMGNGVNPKRNRKMTRMVMMITSEIRAYSDS